MKNWTLEDASKRFAELARGAVAHHPQRVELGDREAVVVVNAADYATLTFARDLVDFIRRSSVPRSVPGVVREPEVAQPPSSDAPREPSRVEDT